MTKDPSDRRPPRCPVCGRRDSAPAVDQPQERERGSERDPRALDTRRWCRACGYVWRVGEHA